MARKWRYAPIKRQSAAEVITAASHDANATPPGLRVAELLVPVGRAPLRGEVEEVPDRLQGADVTRVVARLDPGVEELRAPEVPDLFTVAVEDVQDRPLMPFRILTEVVAVVAVGGRGQEAQVAPATLLREGEDARQRALATTARLRCWEACSAAPSSWSSRATHEGQGRSASGRRAASPASRPLVAGVAREHEAVDHQ
jgi:hypothetical protein